MHAARRGRRGFTLIEVLVASAIMGMLFVALMEAFRTGLLMLEHSQRMTVGATLAEELHQMTLTMPLDDPQAPGGWGLEGGETATQCDDIDDLDGASFSPPINADGVAINGLDDYLQEVTVVSVANQDFNQVVADGTSGVYRVTVTVTCDGDQVGVVSWLTTGGP